MTNAAKQHQRHNVQLEDRYVEILSNGKPKGMLSLLANSITKKVMNGGTEEKEGVKDQKEDAGDSDLRHNVEMIHGIPVYGYNNAIPANEDEKVGRLATDDDQVDWFIGFRTNTTDTVVKRFCDNLAGRASCTMTGHPSEHGLNVDVMRATKEELKQTLRVHPEVEFSEADGVVELIPEIPSDKASQLMQSAQTGIPWGLQRINERNWSGSSSFIPSPEGGSGVHVYVIDTGVRTTHKDFEGRAIPTLESVGEQIRECDPADTSCATDVNGHGTHCAGTVAGRTYGVARNATVHAVRVFTASGDCKMSWVLRAIDWVLANGSRPAVVSLSLGAKKDTAGKAFPVAIAKAAAEGVLTVAAAGNEKTDACTIVPASIPEVITVGSITNSDHMSDFSNYGPCIDLFAPGTDIASAGHLSDNSFVTMSGTSMACPHVTGAVAIILGQHSNLSTQRVSELLMQNSTANVIKNLSSALPTANKILHVDGIHAKSTSSFKPRVWVQISLACVFESLFAM